ncbi:MAG: hypothetical protein PHN76_13480 [Advenella sp.]|uniref:hypothetical protein n=1 Tax=Advenella sp. TaxID=1872388 RepID=UPI00258EFB7E|nr:hypothetical protein [Advenella sp.]MDD3759152.1 hypothetical protein [Advenella sp.]
MSDYKARQIMNTVAVASVIFIPAFGFIGYMATNHSFQARCKEAGYKAAQLEACIKRASEGGPVYEENIEGWK